MIPRIHIILRHDDGCDCERRAVVEPTRAGGNGVDFRSRATHIGAEKYESIFCDDEIRDVDRRYARYSGIHFHSTIKTQQRNRNNFPIRGDGVIFHHQISNSCDVHFFHQFRSVKNMKVDFGRGSDVGEISNFQVLDQQVGVEGGIGTVENFVGC